MTAPRRDVIVMGASAGGVEALRATFGQLPPSMPARMLAVIHRSPMFMTSTAHVFSRSGSLAVQEPSDGQPFQPGVAFLAPRDHHMLVEDGVLRLDRGPKQHHTRPAIDPTFRSAARAYRDRVIGVLLTGNLSDGVAGLIEIKAHGGIVLVQDPAEAPYPSMPKNALMFDHVDLVFQLAQLPTLLLQLIAGHDLEDLSSCDVRSQSPRRQTR
jgi:two-component system, chemotaxis family, protein-glutamate methylesterase/glutaminase